LQSLRVEEHTTLAELIALEREWEDLTARATSPTIFQTWDWVVTWYETFGRGLDLRVFSVRDGGRLVGIAPFSSSRIPRTPFTSLYLLGRGMALTEYFDLLAETGYGETVARSVIAALHDLRDRWALVQFQAIPQESELMRALRQESRLTTVVTQRIRLERSLPPTWELFHSSLGRSMKDNVNNYVNRLRRTGRSERVVVPANQQELGGSLDLFLEFHEMRSRSNLKPPHRDRFSTPIARDFLGLVSRRLLTRGRIWAMVLEIDDRPVAAQIWLLLRNRAFRYYSGFDPQWARDGVMTVLTRRGIERAIEDGFTELDFLLSFDDPREKLRWGAKLQPVATVAVANRDIWSRAALAAYRVRDRALARGRVPDLLEKL